jgi:hypothetical protein
MANKHRKVWKVVSRKLLSGKQTWPYSECGDATFSFKLLMSFDFAFILHIMKNVIGITDVLCQALQQKSQDILSVMHLVTTTKL